MEARTVRRGAGCFKAVGTVWRPIGLLECEMFRMRTQHCPLFRGIASKLFCAGKADMREEMRRGGFSRYQWLGSGP